MATRDAEARAARERKQKIFVVVGGLVLVLLLAIQLPKLLGGSETAAPTTTTTTTETTTDTTPGTTDTTPGGETVPPGGSSSVPISLPDTDRPLGAAPGKLPSLAVFDPKDPFVSKVKTPEATDVTPPSSTEPSGKKPPGKDDGGDKPVNRPDAPEPPSKGFTVGDEVAAAVTVISVNGARQVLAPGSAFPAANPVFVLVTEQPRAKAVVVGVAGGAYANGAKTTRLRVGKPLVLVNTATGARYRLLLVSVGNGTAPDKTSDGEQDRAAKP